MASPAFALSILRANLVFDGFAAGTVAVGAWLPVGAAVAVRAVCGVVSVESLFSEHPPQRQ